jgi:hypothetical protein
MCEQLLVSKPLKQNTTCEMLYLMDGRQSKLPHHNFSTFRKNGLENTLVSPIFSASPQYRIKTHLGQPENTFGRQKLFLFSSTKLPKGLCRKESTIFIFAYKTHLSTAGGYHRRWSDTCWNLPENKKTV